MDKSVKEYFNIFEIINHNIFSDLTIINEKYRTDTSGDFLSEISEDVPTISNKMTCDLCSCKFTNHSEQREHFSTDWHLFNLKSSLCGVTSVDETGFEHIVAEVSSISGSENSDCDDARSQCLRIKMEKAQGKIKELMIEDQSVDIQINIGERITFKNGEDLCFSIYRSLVESKKHPVEYEVELLTRLTNLPLSQWAIIMAGGGHFAAAIYKGNTMIAHKTFHRYIVRAKCGTAQSTHDNAGHAPKSAGSTLRRYNEALLTKEIHELLASWSQLLADSGAIFVRANSFNSNIVFGKTSDFDAPLSRSDNRLRSIPFTTRRPTLNEVKRVHRQLSLAHCNGKFVEKDETTNNIPLKSKNIFTKEDILSATKLEEVPIAEEQISPVKKSKKKKPCADKRLQHILTLNTEIEVQRKQEMKLQQTHSPKELLTDDQLSLRNLLFTSCKMVSNTSLIDISAYLVDTELRDLDAVLSSEFGDPATTLLHTACVAGNVEVAAALLSRGADPCFRDSDGKTAYDATGNRTTRNRLRLFRYENPDKFDYTAARIPDGYNPDEQEAKRIKDASKRRYQKKVRKEKQKENKVIVNSFEKEEAEKKIFLKLADSEKKHSLAESLTKRCYECANDITGLVPYEYYDFKFCTASCLRSHRFK